MRLMRAMRWEKVLRHLPSDWAAKRQKWYEKTNHE